MSWMFGRRLIALTRAFLSQLFEQAAARNAKMIELSRQEVSQLAAASNR
jgi:hypothetical protein